MIVKILGVLDIITALVFILSTLFSFVPTNLIIIVASYLLIKGIIFTLIRDFVSIIDIAIAGIIFLTLIIDVNQGINAVVFLFLLQKGIFSMFN